MKKLLRLFALMLWSVMPAWAGSSDGYLDFGNGSVGCPVNDTSMGATLSRRFTGKRTCAATYKRLYDLVHEANPDEWFQWGERSLKVDGYFETMQAAQQGVRAYRISESCVKGRKVVVSHLPVEYVHREHLQYWYCYGLSCMPMGAKDTPWRDE